MFWRAGRVRVLITMCGLTAFVVAAAAVSAAGASTGSSPNRGLLARCARLLGGGATTGAQVVPGSADPQVAAEFSIFRAPRTASDALPVAGIVGEALRGAEATTYDPSASIRLSLPDRTTGPVYAVPATLAAPTIPAGCAQLPALAGLRAALALRSQETGTGAGICLLTTQVVPIERPVSTLPGKRRTGSKGATRTFVTAGCESLTVIASYLGMFGGGLPYAGSTVVLLPDGVSSVTYALASGRQITAPVTGNLLAAPAALTNSPSIKATTRAKLHQTLAAITPATVTEQSADGAPLGRFTRPPSLIDQLVQEVFLLKRLLTAGTSTSSSEDSYVSCSARTHRCLAVVVTTTCNWRHHRCKTSRRIDRYRYVGRRPPRGTTGRVVVPAGPIRARLNRYVVHPGKLSLVLVRG
jgi:hypothetical protein